MGILIPILMMQKHIINHSIVPFTLIYLLIPFVLLFVLWLITEIGFKSKEQAGWEFLSRLTYAYVPLALTAHIAYQIQFVPIIKNLLFSILLTSSISANIVIYSKTLYTLFKIIYWLSNLSNKILIFMRFFKF